MRRNRYPAWAAGGVDAPKPPVTRYRSPLTAHRSPLTAHRSPLTAHRSPLTACRLPARAEALAVRTSPPSGRAILGRYSAAVGSDFLVAGAAVRTEPLTRFLPACLLS